MKLLLIPVVLCGAQLVAQSERYYADTYGKDIHLYKSVQFSADDGTDISPSCQKKCREICGEREVYTSRYETRSNMRGGCD